MTLSIQLNRPFGFEEHVILHGHGSHLKNLDSQYFLTFQNVYCAFDIFQKDVFRLALKYSNWRHWYLIDTVFSETICRFCFSLFLFFYFLFLNIYRKVNFTEKNVSDL